MVAPSFALGEVLKSQFLIFPQQYEHCEERWRMFDQEMVSNPPESDPQKISCGIHSLETAQDTGHIRCKGT